MGELFGRRAGSGHPSPPFDPAMTASIRSALIRAAWPGFGRSPARVLFLLRGVDLLVSAVWAAGLLVCVLLVGSRRPSRNRRGRRCGSSCHLGRGTVASPSAEISRCWLAGAGAAGRRVVRRGVSAAGSAVLTGCGPSWSGRGSRGPSAGSYAGLISFSSMQDLRGTAVDPSRRGEPGHAGDHVRDRRRRRRLRVVAGRLSVTNSLGEPMPADGPRPRSALQLARDRAISGRLDAGRELAHRSVTCKLLMARVENALRVLMTGMSRCAPPTTSSTGSRRSVFTSRRNCRSSGWTGWSSATGRTWRTPRTNSARCCSRLEGGLLWRGRMITTNGSAVFLALSFSHLIMDAWVDQPPDRPVQRLDR